MEYPERYSVGRCRKKLSTAVSKLASGEEERRKGKRKIIEIYWCSHVMLPYESDLASQQLYN